MAMSRSAKRLASAAAIRLLGAGLLGPMVTPVAAFTDPSAHCLAAAAEASETAGVPYNILLALALVETGRMQDGQLKPWPWAVNQAGAGDWAGSKSEAEALAQSALDSGATNIDLGCFQLNIRWHAEHFASLGDMLDPGANALYAAGFLADLFAETGDWSDAAAAYHSRTPEHARTYREKFERTLAALEAGALPDNAADLADQPRPNRFPLLLAGGQGRFGSLVATSDKATPLIGAP